MRRCKCCCCVYFAVAAEYMKSLKSLALGSEACHGKVQLLHICMKDPQQSKQHEAEVRTCFLGGHSFGDTSSSKGECKTTKYGSVSASGKWSTGLSRLTGTLHVSVVSEGPITIVTNMSSECSSVTLVGFLRSVCHMFAGGVNIFCRRSCILTPHVMLSPSNFADDISDSAFPAEGTLSTSTAVNVAYML